MNIQLNFHVCPKDSSNSMGYRRSAWMRGFHLRRDEDLKDCREQLKFERKLRKKFLCQDVETSNASCLVLIVLNGIKNFHPQFTHTILLPIRMINTKYPRRGYYPGNTHYHKCREHAQTRPKSTRTREKMQETGKKDNCQLFLTW